MDPQYTWLSIIDRFADGDVTKYDEIQERQYLELMSILSYWSLRDEKLEKEKQLAQAQNR